MHLNTILKDYFWIPKCRSDMTTEMAQSGRKTGKFGVIFYRYGKKLYTK